MVALFVQICYKILMWSHCWFKFAIKYRCGHIVGSNLLQNIDVVTSLFKNCLEKNCIFFVGCILGISLITDQQEVGHGKPGLAAQAEQSGLAVPQVRQLPDPEHHF